MSDERRALVDKNNASIMAIYGLASNGFAEYNSIMNDFIQRSYVNRSMLDRLGNPRILQSYTPEATFMRYTFGALVNGDIDPMSIVNGYVGAFKAFK